MMRNLPGNGIIESGSMTMDDLAIRLDLGRDTLERYPSDEGLAVPLNTNAIC